jgi:flagellin-like hook-associated protein FlgL
MSLSGTGVNSSLRDISVADRVAGKLGQQLITGKKVQTPEDDPSAWLQAGRAESTASYLDVIQTGLEEVSTSLNVVATTVQAIGKDLAAMQGSAKEALTYPAGDPSRQQLMEDYNTVRQQIDLLVNTTSESGARDLITASGWNPLAGNIQSLVGLNGELKVVHAQVLDTGPNGLNVDFLDPLTATNADLRNALDHLSSAQAMLTVKQQALGADAASIKGYQTRNSRLSDSYRANAESVANVNATEAAMQLQSISAQRSLAMQSLATIGASRDAILELLK